jgi:acetolactate synthase-1/2/3 large subunit
MFAGRYQSADLSDLNYANVADTLGCRGVRVEDPEELAGALKESMTVKDRPTLLDIVVTRDASQMLPGVDNRSGPARKGDRIA